MHFTRSILALVILAAGAVQAAPGSTTPTTLTKRCEFHVYYSHIASALTSTNQARRRGESKAYNCASGPAPARYPAVEKWCGNKEYGGSKRLRVRQRGRRGTRERRGTRPTRQA
ncbi:hypothetical protein DFH08DRAFT_821054 [Mycena albidolilacea]|uniref:Uncharacterized protein n=1 Tax=Mycena albidolilacea TaxID=1033008 RepID=A0AAD7EDD6_9AGAR|nr:hypothetical protein DFH08DRAFT_821054 [Mycena albidolilacea]